MHYTSKRTVWNIVSHNATHPTWHSKSSVTNIFWMKPTKDQHTTFFYKIVCMPVPQVNVK